MKNNAWYPRLSAWKEEIRDMEKYIQDFFSMLFSLISSFRVSDVLDIVVVSFIIYSVIKLVRETRAEQLVKGIVILLLAFALSSQFKLMMLSKLLQEFFQFSMLALLVVFQPELRRALEQIGRSNIGRYWSFGSQAKDGEEYIRRQKRCIEAVSEAAVTLQKSKTGALMVLERQTKLGEIINTGTIVNATPSVALIGNIFFNKAPLHDGAMILRDGMVYAAGCILPLTKSDSVSIDLGTRHRAAIGMSENSDAVMVVVSEETGTISVAINGVLKRNYTKDSLYSELENALLPELSEDGEHKYSRPLLRKVKKNEKK
jgi:diadenylate cyclase